MKDLTGQTFVDRLPVLVSGNGISQHLAIAKIPSSAGDLQANAVKTNGEPASKSRLNWTHCKKNLYIIL